MVSLRLVVPAALALYLCVGTLSEAMGTPGGFFGESQIGQMSAQMSAFTVPKAEFTAGTTSCSTSMAGCTGTFVNGAPRGVEGDITVIDDCTFEISG